MLTCSYAMYISQDHGVPKHSHTCTHTHTHTHTHQIWLKREELAHTGAHKINNAIGQVFIECILVL